MNIVVHEQDETGRKYHTYVSSRKLKTTWAGSPGSGFGTRFQPVYAIDLLSRMFLPSGYPNSVTSDYLRYQFLNAMQAFCNSLASLISSRAILQGIGVGDPNATPTNALLLTILQDVFGRFATILSAYVVGSSLYPEAKTYRLLADIFNDFAVVLDTLSPVFNTFPIPGLRVISLCLSAVLKSLCGISAGGSKAAITMHFANPVNGKGDIGDLNAKDASKETVLALFGMLLGSVIVPHLLTPWMIYSSLFFLISLHLAINYFGVRGLILRSLNRQRLGIIWMLRRKAMTPVASPLKIAELEKIFEKPGIIRDPITKEYLGQCVLGSSFSKVVRSLIPSKVLNLLEKEKYLIWFDHRCLREDAEGKGRPHLQGSIRLHIFLKEGYSSESQLKSWIHAVEICSSAASLRRVTQSPNLDAVDLICVCYNLITENYPSFLQNLQAVGWNTEECALLTTSPSIIIGVEQDTSDFDEKKKK